MKLIMQNLGLSPSALVIKKISKNKEDENIHMDLGIKLWQRRDSAITE